tara:strand:- start:724 stop:888 length:165 start_codon:yes stop_codon:yes gene_type:complete
MEPREDTILENISADTFGANRFGKEGEGGLNTCDRVLVVDNCVRTGTQAQKQTS